MVRERVSLTSDKMVKANNKLLGLAQDVINGLLFSLRAKGRSVRTIGYYRDLLLPLLDYAQDRGWGENLISLDPHRQYINDQCG